MKPNCNLMWSFVAKTQIFSVSCQVRFDFISPTVSPFFEGHAGARNCKFLERVTITDQACKGDSNWKQYAVHAQDVTVEKIANFNLHKPELMADPPVQEMPVQSLITTPSPNDIISAIKSGSESISVKGNLSRGIDDCSGAWYKGLESL
jgi:hypothetical protein